jgi:hypothetical protein
VKERRRNFRLKCPYCGSRLERSVNPKLGNYFCRGEMRYLVVIKPDPPIEVYFMCEGKMLEFYT